MSLAFPYTYISCPCSDASRRPLISKRSSRDVEVDEELQQDDDERTFDPRHPRSSFSLFPPEHLLYCEECHDIKCPRCVTEEIICWYCPSCLFETHSSGVRGEKNRCARNCFNCPICTSQLITASLGSGKDGPFILNCNYCLWNTLNIGIKFQNPTGIREQLEKIFNGGKPKPPQRKGAAIDPARKSSLAREPFSPADLENDSNPMDAAEPPRALDATTRFDALKSFYKEQITTTAINDTGPNSAVDLPYSSPSSIARIMNLYTNIGSASMKRARQKPSIMREALTHAEGFQLANLEDSSIDPPQFTNTVSAAQKSFQHPSFLGSPTATSVSDLRPMPTLLRTKRSKRCATCKHILTKPEFKPTSVRYRIKLIALNYIPQITLKPVPVPDGLRAQGPDGGDVVLTPFKPSQWIMTLTNPLFETVSVSLGSPSVTPGKFAHKVTILCPQFEIGKNGDVWDDALNNPLTKTVSAGPGGEQIAGKLYDQGRNWASVVIEIVPASITVGESELELEEDDDVVEIPIRVRLDWRVTEEDSPEDQKKKTKSEKVLEEGVEVDDGRRELSYWMVLGVGRVTS